MANLNTGLTAEQVLEAFYRALHDMTDEQIQALVSEKADTSDLTALETVVSGKASISDVFGIGSNNLIQNGADLNSSTYTNPGIYIRSTSNLNSGIANVPMDGSTYPNGAFKLIVEYVNGENNIRQTLIPLYADTSFFIRHRMTGVNGTWRNWRYYSGVEVVPPATQLKSTPPDTGGGDEER